MGIFKKLADLAKANLNHLLGELEDPNKLKEQKILDLSESKKKAEKLLVTLTSALRSAEDRLRSLTSNAKDLIIKAENFVRENDDAKAKELLRQKQEIENEMRELETEIAANEQAKEKLKSGLDSLSKKISQARSTASIDASNREINKEDAFATFSRMEEKIEAKEYEVEALNELIADLEQKSGARKTFDKHSDPQDLEKELAAIKKKIGQ